MALEFHTRLIDVTANFLKSLKVPFTRKELKYRLETNPYYPSLFSLSEVIAKYNIDSKGIKVNPVQLDELPLPFLAYIKLSEYGYLDFVNVTRITKDAVIYYDGREKEVNRTEFMDSWQSNVIFLAEPNENSGENNFEVNRAEEVIKRNKRYLLILGFSLFFISSIYRFIINSGEIIASSSLILFLVLGLITSVFLLIYEIDKENMFVKNICISSGKTNCDAVLGSQAARILGVSWGEVGFFYFSALVFFLLFPETAFIEKASYISYTSIFSALYIPYSLYYQYKVVKQWCRLCLYAQAILFLNLCWALGFGFFSINFTISGIIFFVSSIFLPILSWQAIKPLLIRARDADKFMAAYKRLYTRLDIFNLTLASQDAAPDGWQALGIHKGNPKAEIVIIKVCSPTCKPCIDSYNIINEIIYSNSNVRLVTLFRAPNDGADIRRLAVRHFLALAHQDNETQAQNAMDYWYLSETRNYEILKKRFPVSEKALNDQDEKIEAMKKWCDIAQIEYTPTVFINGKKLPSTFSLSDLKEIL